MLVKTERALRLVMEVNPPPITVSRHVAQRVTRVVVGCGWTHCSDDDFQFVVE
jgi:hypothetical protein